MYKNYLIIALRSLQRNLSYSFINIAGLSIGITCSIHILLWVYDEVTFNQSFSKYELLYQIKVNNLYTVVGVSLRGDPMSFDHLINCKHPSYPCCDEKSSGVVEE